MNIWQELGITVTHDQREIKRAYARRLKTIDQRSEREAFQQLRLAYESALNHAYHASTQTGDAEPVADADTTSGGERAPTMAESATADAPVATDPASPAKSGRAEANPIAEHEAQQQRDWTRAEELLQVLNVALADVGEARAASSFKAIMASEELENLNLRDALEWRLVFAFCDAEPLSLVFASAVAEHFDWRARADLWRGPAGPALHGIFRRLEVLARFDDLKTRANREAYQAHFNNQDADRKAAGALLAAYAPWWFRWLALSPKVLNAMRALLAEIDWGAPELPQTFLDAKTVAWWREAVAKPRVTFGMAGLALVIGTAQSANFVSVVDWGSFHPAVFVVLAALFTGVTASVLLGVKWLVVRWRAHWQARLILKLAAVSERTLGRWFPNAFRAGLGWRHAALALLLGPFIGLVAINPFRGLPPWVDPRYLPLLIVGGVLIVFAFFLGRYQTSYLRTRDGGLSAAALRRWKFAKYAALGVTGGLLAVSGHGAAVVIYLMFAWYRRSRSA